MNFLEPMEYLISHIGLKLPKHSWKDHKPMPIAAEQSELINILRIMLLSTHMNHN